MLPASERDTYRLPNKHNIDRDRPVVTRVLTVWRRWIVRIESNDNAIDPTGDVADRKDYF
jgi:hypothetical protein